MGCSSRSLLERHFTYELLGMVLAGNDEDFRTIFTEWFGPPDDKIITFFQQTTLPE
ncbi:MULTISPECIES: hypothetical protein [unclassified Ensifer]|uniref:hypothetical protein n=1 Tax=unclassified Ensifer TaxID=2633371 RepID=UPI003F9371DC